MRSIAALRRRLALVGPGAAGGGASRADGPADGRGGRIALGAATFDRVLGGGIARGRLHECHATEAGDAGGATGFALGLARLAAGDAPLLWVRGGDAVRAGGIGYGDGLADLGIDPARVVLAIAPDDVAVLRAGLDGLRCAGLGAVVIECRRDPKALDLTASRRLTLAASASGVTAILLRIAGTPAPSAAETRWSVAAAPSRPLACGAPGPPAFAVELLRQRGGAAGVVARLAWSAADGRFHDARDATAADMAGADFALVRDRGPSDPFGHAA